MKVKVKSLSRVLLFVTPWTVASQAPPSMGFLRQKYWSGLPFPFPGDLPNSGIEPESPALQADTLPSEPPGNFPSQRSSPHPLQWKVDFFFFFLNKRFITLWASLVAQLVKNLPSVRETWVRSLGWEDPLETGKATHSSILDWRIPWTVSSMGLQRVRHD